jgi:uncharacterized membrane protein
VSAAMKRFRTYFLTGLVVAGPLGITAYITWSFVAWVDGLVKPFLPAAYNPDTYLDFPIPGVGLVVALLGLTLLGFLTANIFGRTLLSFGEHLLDRMPLVRNLYRGLKQIFETVLTERGNSFQKAGLIEYPRHGLWSIVFISTSARGELAEKVPGDDDIVSVFLPTTPNPTSGFLIYVRRREIIELDMSVEDAAKLVISGGLVMPQPRPKTIALPEPVPAARPSKATAAE